MRPVSAVRPLVGELFCLHTDTCKACTSNSSARDSAAHTIFILNKGLTFSWTYTECILVFLPSFSPSFLLAPVNDRIACQVVPVLSLPIRVSSVDDPLQNNSAALSNEDKHKESATEHRALAASAFSAGALSCREAILPLSRVTGVASSRRRSHSWVDPCGCCRDHEATHSTEGAHAADNLRHPGQSCCAISADYSLKGQSEHVKAFESVPRGGNGDGDGDDDCDCVHNDSVSDEKRNAVLEERVVLVAESPGQLGIGGKVWDSAFVLCEYLAQAGYTSCTSAADRLCLAGSNRVDLSASLPNGNEKATRAAADATLPESPTRCAQSTASGLVNGRRVLELGAGTGLVSVCCALLGASAVMATDFEVGSWSLHVWSGSFQLSDISPKAVVTSAYALFNFRVDCALGEEELVGK